MYDRLVTLLEPPPNRRRVCDGPFEYHLPEGAVIMAFAMYLMHNVPDLKHVAVHPDGEHGKRFDFKGWLEGQGFATQKSVGSTGFGGLYVSQEGRSVLVDPKSGEPDVVAKVGGKSFMAECKGGVLNTRHSGKLSQLRKGLCEAVGLSLAMPKADNRRQFAVVPQTKTTQGLAERLRPRANQAGIELALVDGHGNVYVV
jgi:hypothetical protein